MTPDEFNYLYLQEIKPLRCDQGGCSELATHQFRIDGWYEGGVCEAHISWLRGIASSTPMRLKIEPLYLRQHKTED